MYGGAWLFEVTGWRGWDWITGKAQVPCGGQEKWRSIVAEVREVMGIREAAEYLGVSHEALYGYIHAGTIPAFKLGKCWKFKKAVLDHWMEKQSAHHKERPERKGRAV